MSSEEEIEHIQDFYEEDMFEKLKNSGVIYLNCNEKLLKVIE